ncbi:MAG TPA: LCP family protein [Patescibacteria group bacterium]|nr:LCP family protein [Patescibacteria group bacterium]
MNTQRGQRPGSPGVAAVLSLFLPGLGQAWLGAVRRGLLIAAPVVFGLVLLATMALLDARGLLETFLRPGWIVALLVAIVGIGVYHVLAIQDAYRVGLRHSPEGVWHGPRPQAFLSPLLGGALAVAVVAYGTLTIVGVKAYDATEAIFVKPDSGMVIPAASFEPTPGPTSGPLPTGLTPPDPTATPVPGPPWAVDGRLNLLLIGSDAGPGRWELRTDTMIVLSVEVATARAVLIGIPRNLVNVPLPPESAGAFKDGLYPGLLNSLYVYAQQHPRQFPGSDAPTKGFRALTGSIQELVGVPLDGVVVVNLTGFVDLIDAIKGLWVDVPYTLYDEHYPSGAGQITVYVPAGCQKLDGTEALQYARSRHSSDDYSRMARQQIVLRALAHQVDPLAVLPKVPKLLDVARDNLWTTLPQDWIPDLATLADRVDANNIESFMIWPPTFPEYLDAASIRRIRLTVRNYFQQPAPTPAAGPKSAPKPCPRPNKG